MLEQVHGILRDYATQERRYQGIIYMMYVLREGQPVPLYIGKSEKYGKKGHNLSANLKGIKATTQHPFARWGYNYAYHLGDLSRVVLGHDDTHPPRYTRWAQALFQQPVADRRLKRDVFFWVKAWEAQDIGPWSEYGGTTLAFLEYQLIGLASKAFPHDLLNEEGVGR